MKTPTGFSNHEEDLDSLLVASASEDFVDACNLLFIHERDLDWHGTRALVDVDINSEYEEEFAEARQVIETRVDQNMTKLLRAIMPIIQRVKENAPIIGDPAQHPQFVQAMTEQVIKLDTLMSFGELFVHNAQFAADFVAQFLIASALNVRERLLAATGMDPATYTDMLHSLLRFKLLQGPLLRVALPHDGLHPEVSFAGPSGLQASMLYDDAHQVAIYGLDPRLRQHKTGQDTALSVFIAAYLNQRSIASDRVAYACARYGTKSDGELDAVVPSMATAFEVKLYESAATIQGTHKLRQHAQRIEQQLGTYTKARTKQLYLVTNLPITAGEELVKHLPAKSGMKITSIAGLDALLTLLQNLVEQLNQRAATPRAKAKAKEA